MERVEIEMAIMKQLEHPNIVAFHEAIDDGSSIFMRAWTPAHVPGRP